MEGKYDTGCLLDILPQQYFALQKSFSHVPVSFNSRAEVFGEKLIQR